VECGPRAVQLAALMAEVGHSAKGRDVDQYAGKRWPPDCGGLAPTERGLREQSRRKLALGGRAALASKGPGGVKCKLTGPQLLELEAVLVAGPAESGWNEDQGCYTLPVWICCCTGAVAHSFLSSKAMNDASHASPPGGGNIYGRRGLPGRLLVFKNETS
jgi:hypothetical protein